LVKELNSNIPEPEGYTRQTSETSEVSETRQMSDMSADSSIKEIPVPLGAAAPMSLTLEEKDEPTR
jgi:hypothetical protein